MPSALQILVRQGGYDLQYVEIPHRPFDEVFHEAVLDLAVDSTESAFVRGLAELQSRRTASGAGLLEFLSKTSANSRPRWRPRSCSLASEVMNDGDK